MLKSCTECVFKAFNKIYCLVILEGLHQIFLSKELWIKEFRLLMGPNLRVKKKLKSLTSSIRLSAKFDNPRTMICIYMCVSQISTFFISEIETILQYTKHGKVVLN